MSTILDKASVLQQVHVVSEAYARISGNIIETADKNDVKILVLNILAWRAIERATPDDRVSDDAAFLARWEASNFGDKLISAMKEPVGIVALAKRLGINPLTLDEALKVARHPTSPLAPDRHSGNPPPP
jgi:hypothetical protein